MAMTTRQVLFLVLGLALLAAPVARAEEEYDEEYYDEGEEDYDPAEDGDASEADVVVLTDANFDDIVGSHKYVLVSGSVLPPPTQPFAPSPLPLPTTSHCPLANE